MSSSLRSPAVDALTESENEFQTDLTSFVWTDICEQTERAISRSERGDEGVGEELERRALARRMIFTPSPIQITRMNFSRNDSLRALNQRFLSSDPQSAAAREKSGWRGQGSLVVGVLHADESERRTVLLE